VLFSDDFDSGASVLWGNEVGNWSASGGVYDAGAPDNSPNAFSSLPFDLGDFAVELDINDVNDGGVWLRSTPAPGTSVGIAGVLFVAARGQSYWHISLDGSSYGGAMNSVAGPATGSDAHFRFDVVGDTYTAYLNGSDTPLTSITTGQFPSGRVALYDFSSQTFDNVVIVPEPATVRGWGSLSSSPGVEAVKIYPRSFAVFEQLQSLLTSRSTIAWVVGVVWASAPSIVYGENGEGFFIVNASNATEFLDIDIVDPNTLLPLPSTFTANAQGEYAMSGLLVLEGNTAEPLGNVEITGLGDPHLETKVTLVIPSDAIAVTGPQLFLSLIAGISILRVGDPDSGQNWRIESQQIITATGTPGTPPASPIASQSAFLETADAKSANANAGVSGPYTIPGMDTRSSGHLELPPVPAESTEEAFTTLVTQCDIGFFDIPTDFDCMIDVTSRTDLILHEAVPGDFNGDGFVNLADYPVWRNNLGAPTEEALNGGGNGLGGIDNADYDYWKSFFGQPDPSAFEATTVPEPGSIALLVL
ncbi:PEP-CTERM domain-containing protein, partial [Durusdinium trenchii]